MRQLEADTALRAVAAAVNVREAERAERQYRAVEMEQAGGARVGNRMGETVA
jgi:hypothetical protein